MLRKPNFFVVGVPKSGTTALCQYLGEHQNVFVSNPKEPFYWCSDFPNSKPLHKMTSLENYLGLFEAAGDHHAAIGEGSTTYMQSRVAIQSIMEFNPKARFIAMLRNPIDVAYGMHGELVRHFLEDEPDFGKAWQLQADRANGRSLPRLTRMDHQLQYGDVASFSPQLQRLTSLVPESQRMVIVFEDFVRDTATVYEDVLSFLGLASDNRTEFPRVHAAKVFRNQALGKLYHDPPFFLEFFVSRFRKWFHGGNGALQKAISGMASKKRPRAPLSDGFRNELKEYFREDVQRASELLNRDLTAWTA